MGRWSNKFRKHVTAPYTKGSKGFNEVRESVGDNKWANVATTALGGSKWLYLKDVAEGKKKWNNKDAANSVSAWRTYKAENQKEEDVIYNEQQRIEALRQAGIENNVKGIRAQFGLFDGDRNQDPYHALLAEDAKRSMEFGHDRYKQAYLSYFNPQLDKQFQGAMKTSKWGGMDRGTDEGSAQQVRERPIGERYIEGRGQIAHRANEGVEGIKDYEQQARLRLEDKARNGLAPEHSVQDELSGLGRNFQRAQNNIVSEGLGDVFGQSGSLYTGYQQNYGNSMGNLRGRDSRVSLFDGDDSSGRYS